MSSMKAMVLDPTRTLVIQDLPVPEVGPYDVLIKVGACSICGSDVNGRDGKTGRRVPPLVMGHESAGEIVAVGAKVTQYKVGDRVCPDSTEYCGNCANCLAGLSNLCATRKVLGVAPAGQYNRPGAFAQYLAVPEWICHPMPDDLPYEEAAMFEPAAVMINGVELVGGLKETDVVAFFGTGLISEMGIRMARLAGAKVVALNRSRTRLDAACKRQDVPGICWEEDTDPVGAILDATGGVAPNIVFEMTGQEKALNYALAVCADNGKLAMIGDGSQSVNINPHKIIKKGLTLYGSCAFVGWKAIPEALRLISSGKLDVTPWLSAKIPLEEGPAMFATLEAGGDHGLTKVVICPNGIPA